MRNKRDRRSKSLGGGLSCLRLYYELFKKQICQILELQNWFFWGKKTTLSLLVRRWVCTRASEESLSCAESITFLSQKTADILNYAKKQRAFQKTNNADLHLLQAQVDPRSTLCNWLFKNEKKQKRKTRNPNPWNGSINASSQKQSYRSRHKTKTIK